MSCIFINRDLIKDYFEYNALKTDSSFPLFQSEILDKEIKNIKISELVCKVQNEKRDSIIYKSYLSIFTDSMKKEIFKPERKNLFIFAIEHHIKSKSRIRSYKGLINTKMISKDEYQQVELDFFDNKSVISFIASLKQDNIDNLISFFFDDSTSFIIKTDNDYKNLNFLNKIVSLININSTIEINYLSLAQEFCSIGDIIYRIGGDSGETYWSLQRIENTNK